MHFESVSANTIAFDNFLGIFGLSIGKITELGEKSKIKGIPRFQIPDKSLSLCFGYKTKSSSVPS